MKKVSVYVLGLCFSLSLLTGCARDISSDSYEEASVGSVASTYPCTVVSVRKVKVSGHEKLSDNTAGILGGALAGGVLGNMVGGGRGRTLATAAGALAGATAGSYAQKKLEEQVGYEYTVKLESGKMMTIVQGPRHPLAPGQAANLIISSEGRSRLVAR